MSQHTVSLNSPLILTVSNISTLRVRLVQGSIKIHQPAVGYCEFNTFSESFVELWHLTRKALPLMPNLKHLLFICREGSGPRVSQILSPECKFKLQTLSWEFSQPDDLQDNFIPFLRTQTSLLHLEVGRWETCPEHIDLSWLPDDVCLNLNSAACRVSSMEHVMRNRHIKALRLDGYFQDDDHSLPSETIAALKRLQYLSIEGFNSFHKSMGRIDLNIRVLELLQWGKQVCPTINWYKPTPQVLM